MARVGTVYEDGIIPIHNQGSAMHIKPSWAYAAQMAHSLVPHHRYSNRAIMDLDTCLRAWLPSCHKLAGIHTISLCNSNKS